MVVSVIDRDDYPPGPVQRVSFAVAEMPCGSCLHAQVCSIRPLLDIPEVRLPTIDHEAIRITGALAVHCAHYLSDGAPVVDVVRRETPAGTEYSAADHIAASRKRGSAGLVKARQTLAVKRAARQARIDAELEGSVAIDGRSRLTGKQQGTYKRSPEARQRMRESMLASYARRRAEAAAIAEGGLP